MTKVQRVRPQPWVEALPLALLLSHLPAQAGEHVPAPPPAKDTAELQQRLANILKDRHVPGMGVAVIEHRSVQWSAGIGLTDVATGQPASADTLFRVGSISKMFVSLAVLKLVEAGQLDLNAPIRGLVPEVIFSNPWEATDPVRVVHLLEHTTGWEDAHPRESQDDPTGRVPLVQALAVGANSRVSRWRPGTRVAYTNSGPTVAALIVEKVTGQPFEEHVRSTLFAPIGMPSADYFDSATARARLTRLYHADGKTPFPYHHLPLWPSGALNALALEMGATLRFLLGRRQGLADRILSEASLERMETAVTSYGAQAGLTVGYGLSNYKVVDRRGFFWSGHNGALDGSISEIYYQPEHGIGFFFSLNMGDWPAAVRIYDELTAFLTRDLPDPGPAPTPSTAAETSRAYEGWYAPADSRVQALAFKDHLFGLVHVTPLATGLRVAPLFGPTHDVLAVDGTRFRHPKLALPTMALMTAPDGQVFVRWNSVHLKVSSLHVWAEIFLLGLFVVALGVVPVSFLIGGALWLFRRALRRPGLHLRLLPVATWLSLVGAALLAPGLVFLPEDAVRTFGQMTVRSLALTGSTWSFALLSLLSLVSLLRAWPHRKTVGRFAYYQSLAVTVVFCAVAGYLAAWGVIGYRSWG
jgi:CubicO group peptidase (beta-lactamase class C family)